MAKNRKPGEISSRLAVFSWKRGLKDFTPGNSSFAPDH